jgi:hypothetical protein
MFAISLAIFCGILYFLAIAVDLNIDELWDFIK